jgi:heptosyltransferase III
MSIKKKLNTARRKFMRSLTKNIGKGNQSIGQHTNIAVKRILICRPNHRLGNLLLITPLVQEVISTFPNARIDLFVKGGIAPTLFREYKEVDQIISLPRKPMKALRKYLGVWVALKKRQYDLVINVDKGSSSGRISVNIANAACKIFGDEFEAGFQLYPDYQHIAKQPIYNFRNVLHYFGISNEGKPLPAMDLRLTPEEITAGKKILTNLVNNERPTICIFTFATGPKCYPPSWWECCIVAIISAL